MSLEAALLPPVSLGDAAILPALVQQAGFTQVRQSTVPTSAHFPAAASFAGAYAQGSSSMTGLFQRLPEPVRMAVLSDLQVALQPYSNADGLTLPMTVHLVVGER